MAPKSQLASRAASGVSTPRRDTESFDSEYTSPLFSAQLQERLRQLDASRANTPEAPSNAGGRQPQHAHHFSKNGLVHAIEVLSEDRRKTSELAREQALGSLLRYLVMRYDPSVLNHELFATIVQAFTTARTEVECVTALQLICVAVTLVDESADARSGDSLDLVNQLQRGLLKRVADVDSPGLRQSLVIAYALLTYFLNAGGGGYGMEGPVGLLMEIAEGTSGADNAPVAAAALHGAALLTTLTSRGAASEIAEGWLFSLVPMLEVPQLAPRLAAAKLVAVLFEASDAAYLRDGDARDACDDILAALESMSQEPISRTSKRDKRVQNLLVKSVLGSCQRILAGAGADAGEGAPGADADPEADATSVAALVAHYHRHSASKSLGITTWGALTIVEHLTWLFGPGIHNHLANNPYIKALLAKEDVHVESPALDDDDGADSDAQHAFHESPAYKLDEAKRSRDLRRQQLDKVERQGRVDA